MVPPIFIFFFVYLPQKFDTFQSKFKKFHIFGSRFGKNSPPGIPIFAQAQSVTDNYNRSKFELSKLKGLELNKIRKTDKLYLLVELHKTFSLEVIL